MKDDSTITVRCDVCKTGHSVDAPALPTKCKACSTEGVMLFHDPDGTDCRRTVCGVCQGKANRIILDRLNGTKRSDADEDILYGRGRR